MIGYERYVASPLADWRRKDLTGQGWTQVDQPPVPVADSANNYVNSALAKVVTSGDVSSPPTLQSVADFAMNYGMWVAYSVSGAAVVTIPEATRNNGGASAPASIALDSTALTPPAAAITFVLSSGTDGSISLSGITLDHEVSQNDLGQYYTGTLDVRVGVKFDLGGAAYTVSKGDDGTGNVLFAGYVAVS
jgi:hypothetical protein